MRPIVIVVVVVIIIVVPIPSSPRPILVLVIEPGTALAWRLVRVVLIARPLPARRASILIHVLFPPAARTLYLGFFDFGNVDLALATHAEPRLAGKVVWHSQDLGAVRAGEANHRTAPGNASQGQPRQRTSA